ncbi:MAG TPA: 4-hydroxy-3-methylbut-2-enyl diphosphate reductase [Blastocatellia bacterium]|jgi:4-hydroxy-3-methylbut-2-enyl diphosphate reductase
MGSPGEAQQRIVRRGFGLKNQIRDSLMADFHSDLVERIRGQNNTIRVGRLTFRLAEEFGFCYGVDFALNLAYETRRKFPDRRIFLTNEIIHNPSVNSRLREMGIEFIDCSASNPDRFAQIESDDIVMLPAFGAPASEHRDLREKSCLVVDTTCGSVVAVWKRVQRYASEGITTIIHGKHAHEETRATSSQVTEYEGGKYLVVLDKAEAALVCRQITEGGDSREFMKRFKQACSPGFDPDTDLQRVGLANQTTMLSSESLEIAEMFREAITRRYGCDEVTRRFRHFDTICTATQDRQDAVEKLVREDVDLMIVIGGYNSSNTAHLCEISSLHKPAYHIGDAGCIVSRFIIRHKPVDRAGEVLTENWLPEGNVKIGVTAGASTPDRIVGQVIDRIAEASRANLE